MFKSIARVRVDQGSMKILWTEAVLFSALFGLIFRSGPVAIMLFMILFAFLHSQSRVVYAVFILSFLWGFIFAGIAFELGWVWALLLGGFVFYKGVRIHLRDLKQADIFVGNSNNGIGWRQNWYLGPQNMN